MNNLELFIIIVDDTIFQQGQERLIYRNYVVKKAENVTFGGFEAVEMHGLGVVDHGGQPRVDVGEGGA